jgi:hypothetical protein
MIDMHKRGIDGRALFDDAKLLLAKHSAKPVAAKPVAKTSVKPVVKAPVSKPAKP